MFSRYQIQFLKYYQISLVSYRDAITYIADLIFSNAQALVLIWIFVQLYRVSYQQYDQSSFSGLTLPMVVWSIVFVQTAYAATKPHLIRIIDHDIKDGNIAYQLNKPYHYVYFQFYTFLGRFLAQYLANFLVCGIFAYLLVGGISLSLVAIFSGAILLLMGIGLHFFISVSIGLSGFWLEETSLFSWIYQKAQLVFGGMILPLALFPDYLRNIAEWLPFSQLFYSGARLIVNYDFQLFQKYLLIQVIWLVFFYFLSLYLYRAGVKNVSLNGG